MSRRPIVHQFTAVLAERDAVGHHTVAFNDLLTEMGCEATVYAAHVHPELASRGRDFRRQPDDPPPDLIVYHASTGTPVGDHVLGRPEPLVLTYHNITPAEFYDPWEPHIAAELDHGRRQIGRLARRARLGFADSTFNADELRANGCDHVVVSPVLFHLLEAAPPPPVLDRVRAAAGPGRMWLFVGRLAPNKAQHDLIAALAASAPDTRLILVGGPSSARYEEALRRLSRELGLERRVHFAGSVPAEELIAWYCIADAFVCLSDHEGFCVPVLEAMQHDLPIVAYDAGAVAETVGDAGFVLRDKSPTIVAAAVDRVLRDHDVGTALVEAGRSQLAALDPAISRQRIRDALEPVLEST